MTGHVALLRGINVGGRNVVKMDELTGVFEEAGYDDVHTVLASGNVLFATPPCDPSDLARTLEKKLKDEFGFEIAVVVRACEQIRRLVESAPFADFEGRHDIKPYVSFTADEPASSLKVPYDSPSGDFRILAVSHRDVLSVVFPSSGGRSGDAMKLVEKEFGPRITTRNWNTVVKIYARF